MAKLYDFPDPEIYRFEADEVVPNSDLPLLIYRQPSDDGRDLERHFKSLFAEHGWTKAWTDTIFDYDHFHAEAHEVLGIARGRARVRFGGQQGKEIEVTEGDVIAIPAGVAHKRLSGSHDLTVVGAYAEGRDYDMRRPDEVRDIEVWEHKADRVPLPHQDPVYGELGPLRFLWNKGPARQM